jgi:hypothetical protein
MDIAFIGRLTKVNCILSNATTSRVRNPGPDLGQAQQRGGIDNPETMATLSTQDTRRRQNKIKLKNRENSKDESR